MADGNSDVFAEIEGFLDQGLKGRPVSARYMEAAYEAILELKRRIDELENRSDETTGD